MQLLKRWFLVCLLSSICGLINFAYADAPTPVGTWKTIDDETGKPRSIIQIWTQNNQYYGRINQVFYRAGEGPKDVCKLCTGPLHNQLILGMTMLWGMTQQESDRWGGGRILDPHNGKIYQCRITVSPDGQQLSVRGYIGIPLVGRSQTWYRVS